MNSRELATTNTAIATGTRVGRDGPTTPPGYVFRPYTYQGADQPIQPIRRPARPRRAA